MGRSQNAGFLFFTWIYNLPYHDQSQIIDENKYTGLTGHFIRRRSIIMGRSQNAVYSNPRVRRSQNALFLL